jgi:hypothetical protein
MKVFRSTLLLLIFLPFSCKDKGTSNEINTSKVRDSIANPVRDSGVKPFSSRAHLRVSARLIYNDGTLSAFDVLNDRSKVLWNAVAGEGDVLKPSSSTKITLDGEVDGLNVKIKNGHKLVIDTTVTTPRTQLIYILNNTGCAVINISIKRNKSAIYIDSIPFHCGE